MNNFFMLNIFCFKNFLIGNWFFFGFFGIGFGQHSKLETGLLFFGFILIYCIRF